MEVKWRLQNGLKSSFSDKYFGFSVGIRRIFNFDAKIFVFLGKFSYLCSLEQKYSTDKK